MPKELESLLIAAVTATIVATISIRSGAAVRTGVRWIFLFFVNLSPFSFGTWKKELSTRETFLAAWFLIFFMGFMALIIYLP